MKKYQFISLMVFILIIFNFVGVTSWTLEFMKIQPSFIVTEVKAQSGGMCKQCEGEKPSECAKCTSDGWKGCDERQYCAENGECKDCYKTGTSRQVYREKKTCNSTTSSRREEPSSADCPEGVKERKCVKVIYHSQCYAPWILWQHWNKCEDTPIDRGTTEPFTNGIKDEETLNSCGGCGTTV